MGRCCGARDGREGGGARLARVGGGGWALWALFVAGLGGSELCVYVRLCLSLVYVDAYIIYIYIYLSIYL